MLQARPPEDVQKLHQCLLCLITVGKEYTYLMRN